MVDYSCVKHTLENMIEKVYYIDENGNKVIPSLFKMVCNYVLTNNKEEKLVYKSQICDYINHEDMLTLDERRAILNKDTFYCYIEMVCADAPYGPRDIKVYHQKKQDSAILHKKYEVLEKDISYDRYFNVVLLKYYYERIINMLNLSMNEKKLIKVSDWLEKK